MAAMRKPTRVELGTPSPRFKGFFSLDEYPVRFERFDGSMSEEQKLLVFERGDAVAALVYDTEEQEVLLTDQFRLPVHLRKTAEGERHKGWLLEVPAGMIREGEKGRETMARELVEEIGLRVQVEEIEQLFRFFVSPGGTTEQITLYFVQVRRALSVGGGGNVAEGEDIGSVRVPVDELFARLDRGELEDAKTIIAALWLKQHLARSPAGPRKGGEPVRLPGVAGR
jgi:ADP-ribose pyrophosphatase